MVALSPDPGSQERNPTPFLRAFALTGGVVVFIAVIAALTVSGAERAGYITGRYSAGFLFGGIVVGVWARLARRRPSFTRDSALQQRLNAVLTEQPGIFGWVLSDTLHPQIVLVMVAKFSDVEGRHFGEFVRGMRSTAIKAERHGLDAVRRGLTVRPVERS